MQIFVHVLFFAITYIVMVSLLPMRYDKMYSWKFEGIVFYGAIVMLTSSFVATLATGLIFGG